MIDKNGTRMFYLSDYLSKDEILSLSEELKRTIYPEENESYMPCLSFDEKGSPVSLGFLKRHINNINAGDDPWKSGTDENTKTPIASTWTSKNEIKSIALNNSGDVSYSFIVSFYSPIYTLDEKQWVKRWTAWMNNDVLQRELLKAKERIKDTETKSFSSDSLLVYDQPLFYQIIENGQKNYEHYGNMIIIATFHPWLSAMKELKQIYLLIAALGALSIYIVSRNILKTYEKQKELADTKNSFITAMAHDLKTPLTVIKGYSENLLDNEDQAKKNDFLSKIINKTDEVNDIVGNMLDLSRIDSDGFELQRKEVVFNDLLSEIFERYLPVMEEKQLTYSVNHKGQFVVVGDERYLEKMLSNLIDNAVSYAEAGSRIKVEIDQNRLSISNKSDSIPEDKMKHIFEFSTGTKGHYGFGLYFAKKVADIHDLLLSIENDTDGVNVSISKK
jgi:signal transduction histidine kinase